MIPLQTSDMTFDEIDELYLTEMARDIWQRIKYNVTVKF